MKCHVGLVVGLWVAFLGAHASAQTISLKFEAAPIVDVVRAVYSDVAGLPVVFSAAALKKDDRVTLLLPSIKREAAIVQIEALARRTGLQITQSGGVVLVDEKESETEEGGEWVYSPKFRSVSYLVELVQSLFPQGSFSYQRGVQTSRPSTAHPSTPGQKDHAKPDQSQQPITDAGNTAYSLLDKAPDVIVFRGTARNVSRLEKLIAQLDIPTPELLVKAIVFEVGVNGTESNAIGLAATILKGKLGLQIGKATAGEYSAIFKSTNLTAIIDALKTDQRFKVVSSPTLRVQSGKRARILVGNQTPVAGQAQLDRNGNPIQSVDYKPSGVILELDPRIYGEVAEIQIGQQISNFVPTTTGVNNSPTLVTRELSTSVGVKDGEILVLGGLDENKETKETRGLSFLPSFLQPSSVSNGKTEILLVLQAERI